MPIPQDLSTAVENPTEGSSDNGDPPITETRPGRAPRGEGGLEDSTVVFHTARAPGGLDVLSVVKRLGQRGWAPRILSALPAGAGPDRARIDTDGQRQADVSAEQPSPGEGAWFPAPDADPGRSRDPGSSPP